VYEWDEKGVEVNQPLAWSNAVTWICGLLARREHEPGGGSHA